MIGSFSVTLKGFATASIEAYRKAARAITIEAFGRVLTMSPVDTGRFRANWGVNINSPYSGVDAAGVTGNGMGTVSKWDAKGSIYLCNNLSYANALEDGHSKQAPIGMVKVTVVEMQAAAEGIAAGAVK